MEGRIFGFFAISALQLLCGLRQAQTQRAAQRHFMFIQAAFAVGAGVMVAL